MQLAGFVKDGSLFESLQIISSFRQRRGSGRVRWLCHWPETHHTCFDVEVTIVAFMSDAISGDS